MNGLAEFAKLLIERCWALGVLLLVPCFLGLVALHYGAQMPPPLREWLLPTALLGIGLCAVSLINVFNTEIIKKWKKSCRHRHENTESIKNISVLTPQEAYMLEMMILHDENRFEMDRGNSVYNGLRTKYITEVIGGNMSRYAIVRIRKKLIKNKEQYFPKIREAAANITDQDLIGISAVKKPWLSR